MLEGGCVQGGLGAAGVGEEGSSQPAGRSPSPTLALLGGGCAILLFCLGGLGFLFFSTTFRQVEESKSQNKRFFFWLSVGCFVLCFFFQAIFLATPSSLIRRLFVVRGETETMETMEGKLVVIGDSGMISIPSCCWL